MDQKRKVEAYQKTYDLLKGYPEIMGLERPEEQENLELSGRIGRAVFSYSLKLNVDLLKLQAEIACPERSVEDMLSFGNSLTRDMEEVTCTAYNGTLILMNSYLFHSESEETAFDQLMTKPEVFARMLIRQMDVITQYVDHDEKSNEEIPEELPEEVIDIEEDNDMHPEEPDPLSARKAEFFQYCKDQNLLIEEEKSRIKKTRESLENQEKNLDQKRKSLKKREDELNFEKKKYKDAFREIQKQKEALEKEKKDLKDSSLDQRMILRRKKLEQMEESFFGKQEEFQRFERETLESLETRLLEVKEKESQLSEEKKVLEKTREELEKEKESLAIQKGQFEEEKKSLMVLKMELSDRESELKMASIHKTEAENLKRRMDIALDEVRRKKEEQQKKEEELSKKEEKLSNLEKKMGEHREETRGLKEKLKSAEDDNTKLESTVHALSDRIKLLEDDNSRSQDEIRRLTEKNDKDREFSEDILSKNRELTSQKEELEKQLQEAVARSKEHEITEKDLEISIARIRGELFEMKEKDRIHETEKERLERRIRELQDDQDTHPEATGETCSGEWELDDGIVNGIPFEPVIGEKEHIYHGFAEGLDIYIDLPNHMIQAERQIRQSHRVIRKLDHLNGLDLSMSFFMKGKKVIGRKYGGDNIRDAIRLIIENIKEI